MSSATGVFTARAIWPYLPPFSRLKISKKCCCDLGSVHEALAAFPAEPHQLDLWAALSAAGWVGGRSKKKGREGTEGKAGMKGVRNTDG